MCRLGLTCFKMVLFNLVTDYFQTIHSLFRSNTFCDLKLVTTQSSSQLEGININVEAQPILCHSIVLCAALPELKSLLSQAQFLADDYRTLILEGYDRTSIQTTIDEIYNQLVNESVASFREQWLKSFDLCNYQDDKRLSLNICAQTSSDGNHYTSEKLSPTPFDLFDEKSVSNEHQLGVDGHLVNDDDCISENINNTNAPAELCLYSYQNYNQQNKQNVRKKLSKKTKKIQKEKSEQTVVEKVCFGCLEVYPFSSPRERKSYFKHTLSHCKCDCDITFKSKVEFENHMKARHQNHVYTCDFDNCNSKSTLLKEHIRHRQKHILCSKEMSNVCPDCGREFINSYYMKAHYGSRHKKMKCKICGIYTYGTDDNQKHHNAFHKPKLVCELCGKNFKTKSTLRCHVINVHTPENQRPYKCKFCPKGFLNNRYLMTHVERDHKGNRAFKCRAMGCDRTFTLPEVRKRHEKRDHNVNINLKPGVVSKFEVHNTKEVLKKEILKEKCLLSLSKEVTRNLS